MNKRVYIEIRKGKIERMYAMGAVEILVRDFDIDGVEPEFLSKEGKSCFVDTKYKVGKAKWEKGETTKRYLNYRASLIEKKHLEEEKKEKEKS